MAFIRLRPNTLQLAAGLKGKVNRAEAHQSEGGLLLLYRFHVEMATAQFRFDTPTACGGELHVCLAWYTGRASGVKPEVIKRPPLPDGRATPTRQGQFQKWVV
jgi:hypothetical protein